MAERPPTLQIDDLAEPRLPHSFREMAASVGPLARALPWSIDGAMAQAQAETGLADFGDDIFREPLSVALASADTESRLSSMGRMGFWSQLIRFLRNRLLIEDYVAKHPDALEQEVRAPIVIVGLPRTGTTHLHNLISADAALRSLPWWEAQEPVPPLAEQGQQLDPDPRVTRAAEGLAIQHEVMPLFNRMHDMWPEHVHEEIDLLGAAGSTMYFETLATLTPSWRDWYLATDQTPWYTHLKRTLQVLQHQRGGTRWILKSPQHLEQFRPLMHVFPDATFVVTHRDPVSITASFATMIAYSARLSRDPVDPHEIGAYWANRIEQMLRASVRDRGLLPEAQSLDIHFDAFMKDDIASVERIYASAGQPFDDRARAAMGAFMAEHPRGKHGRLQYDLADFGLDRTELRERFAFYVDHFGIAPEGD